MLQFFLFPQKHIPSDRPSLTCQHAGGVPGTSVVLQPEASELHSFTPDLQSTQAPPVPHSRLSGSPGRLDDVTTMASRDPLGAVSPDTA